MSHKTGFQYAKLQTDQHVKNNGANIVWFDIAPTSPDMAEVIVMAGFI